MAILTSNNLNDFLNYRLKFDAKKSDIFKFKTFFPLQTELKFILCVHVGYLFLEFYETLYGSLVLHPLQVNMIKNQ